MTSSPYKAAIIGLGNIAWKLDADPAGRPPLTHAAAYMAHPRVRLAGGCSPISEEVRAFSAKYQIPAFGTVGELLSQIQPEIVSICSPTEFHFEHAAACIEAGVKMIWLEKPPCSTLEQLERLAELARGRGNQTSVLVNYIRRYAECCWKLKDVHESGLLGKAAAIQITYSRGLAVNGCHLLDLVFYLTGDQGGFDLLGVDTPLGPDNPWLNFRLHSGLPVSIVGFPLPFHCIDISLTYENGRASILHGGMTVCWETAVEHELFPGFHRLDNRPTHPLGEAGLQNCMTNALADLIEAHEAGREPVSNLVTASTTQGLLDRVFARIMV